MVETGAIVVGSISIITLFLTKLKCYAKKNGSCNYGIGFTDKNLIDDDDTEIKTMDLGAVPVMYVKKRRHTPPNLNYQGSESDEENVDRHCCFKTH